MKIYPSKHKIKAVPTSKVDTSLNIPLAYVDIDYTKYDIRKIIDPRFSTNQKTIIYPEQKFDNKDFLVFNEFEEEVNKNNLFTYTNNQYMFYPNNTVKFSPRYFLWRATVKKNFQYNISNTYDIKIGCKNNNTLAGNITTALMNPSERGMLVYENIKINSNDKTYDSFSTMNDADADIMFIKTHNCKHYDVENTSPINIDAFLNNHTNVWMGCEDALAFNDSFKMLIASEPTMFNIASPMVAEGAGIVSSYYFDINMVSTDTDVIVHNIFDTDLVPALILEYENKGFVVISSYTILDNPLEYEAFLYEVMMYIYCNSYASTDFVEDWITYKVPDYEVTNGIYTIKTSFTSKHSISSELGINDSFNLVHMSIKDSTTTRVLQPADEVIPNTGSIVCIGQNNGKPIFATDGTLSGYTEPNKPIGWKSIFYNGSIYYIDKLYYLLEQDITNKIMMTETETDLIVKLFGFKSSSLNINKQSDTTLKISFIKTDGELVQRVRDAEYTIYYNTITSNIAFCFAEDYKESDDRFKLFNIIVQQTDDAITMYDMRQLGGGLAEEEPDDFELVDIGHINGRPYRKAGALVLTMPTKYKPYESYIQKVLDKYKTAEDYIAVFFEDKEDDDN